MTSFTGRGDEGHVDLLIGSYALDALDDLERAAVERHLRSCPTCSAEAAGLVETAALLGGAEATTPPPALRDRVLAAARGTAQRPPLAPAGRKQPNLRARRLAAVAAAVVVLAGSVGGTWWVQQNRVSDERARVVAAQQETARLKAVITAPDARTQSAAGLPTGQISAVYSASQRLAVLTFGGLAEPGAGKTYQLWRITSGTPTSLEALPAGVRSGSVLVDHLSPSDALGVSVEKLGGAASPSNTYALMRMGR